MFGFLAFRFPYLRHVCVVPEGGGVAFDVRTQIHRVFVVEDLADPRPVDVISQTDVLAACARRHPQGPVRLGMAYG